MKCNVDAEFEFTPNEIAELYSAGDNYVKKLKQVVETLYDALNSSDVYKPDVALSDVVFLYDEYSWNEIHEKIIGISTHKSILAAYYTLRILVEEINNIISK